MKLDLFFLLCYLHFVINVKQKVKTCDGLIVHSVPACINILAGDCEMLSIQYKYWGKVSLLN